MAVSHREIIKKCANPVALEHGYSGVLRVGYAED
ncbi:hypothetical protein PDIG_68350 [Penicillium digitatum PHI26]|uniref:Uncharacterized protein n=2 Tax=Penicillium digitatum TaxID=36651 RepID=K9FG71_PEND2|nr:hypothetical protein PDIP_77640 [Penicillium digitatum Pd1]EKV06728.1 hypothetical protein PDIP_77640 [Penicillium digitatum Pd1]EKV08430.1 hypothetical protein PDIG_68350 [Penicillium digitatum PHI26]